MTETRAEIEKKVDEESVGVLIFKEDKVLTVRNRAGTGLGEGVWGLPGGKKLKINKETDQETAVRELKQETGLDTQLQELIEFPGNYFQEELPVNGHMKTVSWRVFICKDFEGDLLAEATIETMPEWVSIDKLALYHTGPNVLQVIQNGQDFLIQINK